MYIFGAQLSQRGLAWYLLNSSKAHAPRGLDSTSMHGHVSGRKGHYGPHPGLWRGKGQVLCITRVYSKRNMGTGVGTWGWTGCQRGDWECGGEWGKLGGGAGQKAGGDPVGGAGRKSSLPASQAVFSLVWVKIVVGRKHETLLCKHHMLLIKHLRLIDSMLWYVHVYSTMLDQRISCLCYLDTKCFWEIIQRCIRVIWYCN